MKENIRVTPDPKGNTGQVLPTSNPEPAETLGRVPDAESKPPEGSSPTAELPKASVSQRKLEANRRNAQKSTGPTSKDGKARSAQNSYKHGFFAKALFQNAEQLNDLEEYDRLSASLWEQFKPVGYLEKLQIERIATDALRLKRIIIHEQRNLPAWLGHGCVMRYQATLDRQLEKKIHELERLQEKRRAASVNLPESESDKFEDDADDESGSGSATIVLPLHERAPDEGLDGAAKPSEGTAGMKPNPTRQRLARRRQSPTRHEDAT
jgi:hypothetical protein